MIQQFAGAQGVTIAVEYGLDRRPRAVRLAPSDYNPRRLAPEKTMDPVSVSEVMGFFVAPERLARITAVNALPEAVQYVLSSRLTMKSPSRSGSLKMRQVSRERRRILS